MSIMSVSYTHLDVYKRQDTGSAEGQIALFTFRINHLSGHLKKNHKDYATEKSLVKLVGKRKRLLDLSLIHI